MAPSYLCSEGGQKDDGKIDYIYKKRHRNVSFFICKMLEYNYSAASVPSSPPSTSGVSTSGVSIISSVMIILGYEINASLVYVLDIEMQGNNYSLLLLVLWESIYIVLAYIFIW